MSFIDSDDDDDDVLREITANKRQAPKLSPKLNQPTKKYKPDSTMADLSSVSHAMPPPACAALPDPKPATLKVLVAGALNFGAVENDEPQMAEYGQVLDEIGKLAREHQCDLILLTGGLCCASTPDDEVLIYVAHRLRKLVSRGTQNILFKTRQTPSGAPPCWMSQTTRITMPVIAIYGKHNRPIIMPGEVTEQSALGIYANRKMIEIGCQSDHIKPFIFEKNNDEYAIYAMSWTQDAAQVIKALSNGKLTFAKVNAKCTRVLLCHLTYNEELKSKLDFDIIIWGNEPDQKCSDQRDIIAHSPTKFDMESQHDERAKCVSILDLGKRSAKQIELKQARPIVVQYIKLRDHMSPMDLSSSIDDTNLIREKLTNQIEAVLARQPKSPKPPLFKVYVDLEIEPGSYFPTVPVVSMGHFDGKIYNSRKMLIFVRGKKKIRQRKAKAGEEEDDAEEKVEMQKVVKEDADLIQQHLACDSKFIHSSVFSLGIKLRLEGDVNALSDVMKWAKMRSGVGIEDVKLSSDVNRGEGDDIKTIEKCLLETKDTLKSEIEQFNDAEMLDQMRRDLRESHHSRIKPEPARGKRKSPKKKPSATTFKKEVFSSDDDKEEILPQKSSRSQRQASLLNYMS